MKTTDIEVKGQKNPAEMIRLAVETGSDLEKLEKLLALQERWEANEAKKAYHEAMAQFKANAPKIIKDKQNAQYKSMYTTLGNLVNTVNPELSKHGLSASWDIFQNGIIKVTCKMTHRMGHSEHAEASAPADTSGSKNAIQQIKSTITYLKAVTFESICGLASTDANLDDDANGATSEPIDEAQLATLVDYITAANADTKKFLKAFNIDALENLPKASYGKAIQALKNKIEAKGGKK